MTFLNLALLVGIAAAALPLLIHLFSKSRPKVIAWAAMHLLIPAAQASRRRLRFENLLLLLVRVLIPVLLALALARPVLTGAHAPSGDTPTAMVILFDNSYSMQAIDSGVTRQQRATQAVAAILSRLPAGSEASVVLMSGGVRTLGSEGRLDFLKLNQQLDAVPCDGSGTDTSRALGLAATILKKTSLAQRSLVIVSDFQPGNWSDSDAPARETAWEQIAALPVKPIITWVNVGATEADNVSVDAVTVSPARNVVNRPIVIRVAVSNVGGTSHSDLHVYLRVDGRERGQARLSLPAGQSGQAIFTHTFEQPGPHLIEASTDDDALAVDNTAFYSTEVIDQIPVLLVNGEPSREPLRGETDFLSLALRPLANSDSMFQPRVVETLGLTPRALDGIKTVVLANVRQLSDIQVEMLGRFVRAGGGLVIFPGNRIQASWYNDRLFENGQGLLPARLGRLTANSQRATRIAAQRFDHPALTLFNDPRNGNLTDAEIRRWFELEISPPESEQVAAKVIARLENGDPFLVERHFGRGQVILAATACDTDWSSLPLNSSYVMLMREIIASTSIAQPQRNVATGTPLILHLDSMTTDPKIVVSDPTGQKHEIIADQSDGLISAKYADTSRPGIYTFIVGSNSIPYVVSASRSESRLAAMESSKLASLAKSAGATVISSGDEYSTLDQTRRFGREIWRPIFIAVVAMLFVELFLQQWITRKRPA